MACVAGVTGGQRTASDSLELVLQAVISSQAWMLGTNLRDLWKISRYFESSLQPL